VVSRPRFILNDTWSGVSQASSSTEWCRIEKCKNSNCVQFSSGVQIFRQCVNVV